MAWSRTGSVGGYSCPPTCWARRTSWGSWWCGPGFGSTVGGGFGGLLDDERPRHLLRMDLAVEEIRSRRRGFERVVLRGRPGHEVAGEQDGGRGVPAVEH